MSRLINLRQIEIFKATIEQGTISRAAEIISISQPAASKLLVQFETNTGLKLFNRNQSRLVPTPLALRLYDEVDRIFASVREVESAIESVKREDQGQLSISVIPALGGTLIQEVTMNFLKSKPKVYCSISTSASQKVIESVRTRKIDVGLVSSRINEKYLVTEPLLEHPLVCIMPKNHPLAQFETILPEHLDNTPFISFKHDSYIGQKIENLFKTYKVKPKVVLTADSNPTLRQFVVAGLGVSLVHPLFIAGIETQLTARPFSPSIPMDFLLCYARDARNADLIAEFIKETKETTEKLLTRLTEGYSKP